MRKKQPGAINKDAVGNSGLKTVRKSFDQIAQDAQVISVQVLSMQIKKVSFKNLSADGHGKRNMLY